MTDTDPEFLPFLTRSHLLQLVGASTKVDLDPIDDQVLLSDTGFDSLAVFTTILVIEEQTRQAIRHDHLLHRVGDVHRVYVELYTLQFGE